MATISITVPAAYREDMRRALVREIVVDVETLDSGNKEIDERDGEISRDDFACAQKFLGKDLRLLAQLTAANGDGARLSLGDDVDDGTFAMTIEAFVRIVSKRLQDALEEGTPYHPEPFLDIAERLGWAAKHMDGLAA